MTENKQNNKLLVINIYYILPVIVIIGQFAGNNIAFLICMLTALSIILTSKVKINKLKNIIVYFTLFLVLTSIINLYQRIPDLYSLLIWGQFLFIAVIPIFIKDVNKLLSSFIIIIIVLFLLDLLVNITALAGLYLPGIAEPAQRPGELLPRMQGIMNSNLFSSYLSFIFLCLLLDKRQLKDHKKIKLILLFLVIFNILLAGARRTYILSLSVIILRLFPAIKKNSLNIAGYISSIVVIVVTLTFTTAAGNLSNSLRSQLWLFSVEKIMQKPILGHGLYFPDTSEAISNIETLKEMVVTESFILSIGYSFGSAGMIFFVFLLFYILIKEGKNREYCYQYGIFTGMSVELFFGGTLANTLSTFIFFLSAYSMMQTVKNTEQNQLTDINN